GSYRIILWSTTPYGGLFYAAGRDITAIRAAENERDRFFSMAVDILGTFGFDGEFKRLNPAFTKTLGFTEDEITSKPFMEWVHPEDQASTRAVMGTLSEGKTLLEFENRYRTKSGDYRWLEWKAVPILDEGIIYAAARDVTERKKAEQSLQQVNVGLELRVVERNAELERVNETLRIENVERQMTVGALREAAAALQHANTELRTNESRPVQGNRVFTKLMRLRAAEMKELEIALQQITKASSQVIDVERCSVWLFNQDSTAIRCLDLYETATGQHSKDLELLAQDYPYYFEAMQSGELLIADDASSHPATQEFAASYLTPRGIVAMLDAPIIVGGHLVGVLCYERIEAHRP
ncbi:MAG: PAS domain S-box protein, partial [Proteobacteria bacterium]